MTRTTAPASGADTAAAISERAIVSFFDALVQHAPDVTQLVMEAAAFAGCIVGFTNVSGRQVAFTAAGRMVGGPVPASALRLPVGATETIWIDGWGHGVSLARFFLQRLAGTVSVVERLAIATAMPGFAPFEILAEPDQAMSARAAALRRLGLHAQDRVRVAVFAGVDEDVERFATELSAQYRVVARMDDHRRTHLLIVSEGEERINVRGVPKGMRAAYSRWFEAEQTDRAMENAHNAYRFTLPSPHSEGPYTGIQATWVNGADIRGLEVLCRLRAEDMEDVRDLRILDELVAEHGPQILQVLEAYASTESLRAAASLVFMHHNTMAHWVTRARSALGFTNDEPLQRARLFVALCLYRVRREFLEP